MALYATQTVLKFRWTQRSWLIHCTLVLITVKICVHQACRWHRIEYDGLYTREGCPAVQLQGSDLLCGLISPITLFLQASQARFSLEAAIQTLASTLGAQEYAQTCGMSHIKWLCWLFSVIQLLTGTVELLSVWIVRSWEVCVYHSFSLFPTCIPPCSSCCGCSSKVPSSGLACPCPTCWSAGWASPQLLLPPEYCFLLEETTPNADARRLGPTSRGGSEPRTDLYGSTKNWPLVSSGTRSVVWFVLHSSRETRLKLASSRTPLSYWLVPSSLPICFPHPFLLGALAQKSPARAFLSQPLPLATPT